MAIIRVPYDLNGNPMGELDGLRIISDHSGCKSSGAHNQSECGVLQSDATLLGWNTFWGDGAGTAEAKYYQDFADHPNGTDNVYHKFIQDPSCKVKEVGTYAELYDPDTEMQIKLHKYWSVGDCGTVPPPTYLTVTLGANGGQPYEQVLMTRDPANDVTDTRIHYAYSGPSLITTMTMQYTVNAVNSWWEINNGGRVSQQYAGAPVGPAIPPSTAFGAWPNLGVTDQTVLVEYGDTTGALRAIDSTGNLAVDNSGSLAEEV